MNILHSIVIKISHVIVTVLLFTGLTTPVQAPETTIVDVQPTGTIEVVTSSKVTTSIPQVPTVTIDLTPTAQPVPEAIATTVPASIPAPIPQPQVIAPVVILQQQMQDPTSTLPSAPEPTQQQKPMITIQVISPIPGKGLGRTYQSSDVVKDESNYIELGFVVYENGEPKKTSECKIMATDVSQNKVLNGTGNVATIYEEGIKKVVPFYPFSYEFHTPGDHSIEFVCEGQTHTVMLNVK